MTASPAQFVPATLSIGLDFALWVLPWLVGAYSRPSEVARYLHLRKKREANSRRQYKIAPGTVCTSNTLLKHRRADRDVGFVPDVKIRRARAEAASEALQSRRSERWAAGSTIRCVSTGQSVGFHRLIM
eukprot:1824389-Rhodomonas_salina.2